MTITTADLDFYLSGGAANTSGDASLGGAISSTAPSVVVNELFDYVAAVEAESGDTEYRCIYVKNGNATYTLYNAVIWISANTPSVNTDVQIGLGTSAVSGEEQTIANENTAPTGVTFSTAASEVASLSIGDLAPGEHKAVWIKRTVTATTTGVSADYVILRFKGGAAV
jgi:MinD superfamily P-loop ATPase